MENGYKDIEILEEFDDDSVIVDIDEVIKDINLVFENLDKSLKNVFLCEPIFEEVNKLRAKNYNKLTKDQREQVLAEIHTFFVESFDNIMDRSIYFTKERIDDSTGMMMEENRLIVDEQLLTRNNQGLLVLTKYLYKIRESMIYMMISSANEMGIRPDELEGKGRDYYMNLSRSVLNGAWCNELSRNDVNYSAQPVVVDCDILTFELLFEYIKHFYKEDKIIDGEVSDLLNGYIMFYDSLGELLERRKVVLNTAIENVGKMYDEHQLLCEYLDVVASDLTDASDDQFYQLFNSPYYVNLANQVDDFFTLRLENLANGLIQRTFKKYNTENVDIPVYQLDYDEANRCVILNKIYKNKEPQEFYIYDFSEVFTETLMDISEIAADNLFFEFKNEKERQDCLIMKTWIDSKNGNFNEEEEKIRFDGLNIISIKLNEVVESIVKKMNSAIAKSRFKPQGISAIRVDNKDSLYDYHEFKNGLTREQVSEKLLKKVKIDLARGGR